MGNQGVPAAPSGHSGQAPEPASGLGHAASVPNAVEIVKRALRAQAVRLRWPQPGIMDAIRGQEDAKKALDELPALVVPSYPYYQSVDDGQSGVIVAGHLTDEQMPGVPLLVAHEVLDELGNAADGVRDGCRDGYRRDALLSAYGPALAELVCQAIDEALESREESHKRLCDHSGKIAPLASSVLDEPLYDECAPDDEFASPVTSFDFWNAIEAAQELIEERDRDAAEVRCGAKVAASAMSTGTAKTPKAVEGHSPASATGAAGDAPPTHPIDPGCKEGGNS